MKKALLLILVFLLFIGTMVGCSNIDSKIPAVSGEINNNSKLIEEIEYKKGKQLRLFENYFEFDENKILYNDIEIIKYSPYKHNYSVNGIPSRQDYSVEYTFVLN